MKKARNLCAFQGAACHATRSHANPLPPRSLRCPCPRIAIAYPDDVHRTACTAPGVTLRWMLQIRVTAVYYTVVHRYGVFSIIGSQCARYGAGGVQGPDYCCTNLSSSIMYICVPLILSKGIVTESPSAVSLVLGVRVHQWSYFTVGKRGQSPDFQM